MKTKTFKSRLLLNLSIILMLIVAVLGLSACSHEHEFETDYSYNETHHWLACVDEDCDEKKNYDEHTTGEICDVCHYGAGAVVTTETSTNYYTNLVEAVASVTDNTQTTITLIKDLDGNGIVVEEGRNIVIDFNGHSYTLTGTMVGSIGTQTNGFQLLKGSNITFKNGTIQHTSTYHADPADKNLNCYKLVQNYSNLTLEDMVLDASGEDTTSVCDYALSNNCGNILIKGNTQLIADDDDGADTDEDGNDCVSAAFDLWYGLFEEYSEGITVTFDETFTGTVKGFVEYGGHANTSQPWAEGWLNKTKLVIKGGNFDIDELFVLTRTTQADANIEISGGTFDVEIPEDYLAEGYRVVSLGGSYSVEIDPTA